MDASTVFCCLISLTSSSTESTQYLRVISLTLHRAAKFNVKIFNLKVRLGYYVDFIHLKIDLLYSVKQSLSSQHLFSLFHMKKNINNTTFMSVCVIGAFIEVSPAVVSWIIIVTIMKQAQ